MVKWAVGCTRSLGEAEELEQRLLVRVGSPLPHKPNAPRPAQVNVGLIAVVLVAYVSPVVVARECRRRAKDLEAVSSPLDAPPSAETPAQTPH